MHSIVKAILAILILVSSVAFSAEKKFGKKLSIATVTKVSDVFAEPAKFNGKKVLIEGSIVDVCEKRGCWIRISSDKESESIIFKVEDGIIVFPMTIKGKKVRAEGIVDVKVTSIEDQITQGKERAKEEGTEFDSKTITAPKTTVRLMGEGAIVR